MFTFKIGICARGGHRHALAQSGQSKTTPARQAFAVLAMMALSACSTTPPASQATSPVRTVVQDPNAAFRIAPTNKVTPPGMEGRPIVRVALLAPFSSDNAAIREEAQTLQSAAELALVEHGDNSLLLIPKDSGDNADSAREAARQALQEGADFILGPLFASGVGAIAPYARANSVPMFSFSTDVSEAGRGVYVLTFLPEDEAQQIVRYAADQGVKRLTVLAPQGRYGDRIVSAAREAAEQRGLIYLGEDRYDPRAPAMSSAIDAARRAAQLSANGPARQTAVLIPERGAMLRAIVQTMTQAGANARQVRYLGTGLWNDADTLSDVRLSGGWYVTPDVAARAAFEARFQQTYRRRPTRLAGMGYDATAMLARMTRGGSKAGATARAIENPDGFVGVDGLFRFNRNVVQRGMSVNEVAGRAGRVVQAAPTRFNN